MASFHNWTGDEEIDTQVPQFLNEDNTATLEKLDTKFNKSLEIAEASDLNNFKDEGFYCCNINSRVETILNCPTNYAFGLMVWGKGEIVYQEVREYNRSTNNLEYNNCWRRSYYISDGVQGTWSKWQQMSYTATTLAGYGITDGMGKSATNSVSVADILKRNINTSYLRLTGGNAVDSGANLQLCGGNYAENTGQFLLKAADSTHSATLLGSPVGLLKWNNKNIVRSINNSVADENGNVTIDVNSVIVDTELSGTSTNPVQNKAIYSALLDKVGTDIFSGFSLNGELTTINWRQGSQVVGSINAKFYSGMAAAATSDGKGNEISKVYANRLFSNSWVSLQDFEEVKLGYEKYLSHAKRGKGDIPSISLMHYIATGDFTLSLKTFLVNLDPDESNVFTAYIEHGDVTVPKSSTTPDKVADYTLTITDAGTIKYIGSASDMAITSAGLLLNILMMKDEDGDVISIVQASTLS